MAPDASHDPASRETLGQRIGRLRTLLGWTQQELADRVAISRVAISHLEMGISTPGERTVTLLAGIFHLEPHELVEGTAYPDAKADRLPLVAARYTHVELQIALMQRDLTWIARIEATDAGAAVSGLEAAQAEICREWQVRLEELAVQSLDPGERRLVAEAQATLEAALVHIRQSARGNHTAGSMGQ